MRSSCGLRDAYGVPFGLPARDWMLEIGAAFMRTETELILKPPRRPAETARMRVHLQVSELSTGDHEGTSNSDLRKMRGSQHERLDMR